MTIEEAKAEAVNGADACSRCLYWWRLPGGGENGRGECRRYPPSRNTADDADILKHHGGGTAWGENPPQGWPLTWFFDWCGEWKHDPDDAGIHRSR